MGAMATKNSYEVHLYLPERFRETLKRLADAESRSVNNLIQVLLDEAIRRRESQGG
jgi:hypothetical protein